MRKLLFVLVMLTGTISASAQSNDYYLYNIVTFHGSINQEGVRVNIDDGKTISQLKKADGKKMIFKTPAAALMFFIAQGWEICVNGQTSSGNGNFYINYDGSGQTDNSTLSYWIMRKRCTKDEFDKAVEDGIK